MFWRGARNLRKVFEVLEKKLDVLLENRKKTVKKFSSAIYIKTFLIKYAREGKEKIRKKSLMIFAKFLRLRTKIMSAISVLSSTRICRALFVQMAIPFETLIKTAAAARVFAVVASRLQRFSFVRRRAREQAKLSVERTINRAIVWDELINPPGTLAKKAIRYYQRDPIVIEGLVDLAHLRYLEFHTQSFTVFNLKKLESVLRSKHSLVFETLDKMAGSAEKLDTLFASFQKFDRTSTRKTFFVTSENAVASLDFKPLARTSFHFEISQREIFGIIYTFLTQI